MSNWHLVLQGNIPSRTSQLKHILKLLARERLGTRWAKYPFSRCRWIGRPWTFAVQRTLEDYNIYIYILCLLIHISI